MLTGVVTCDEEERVRLDMKDFHGRKIAFVPDKHDVTDSGDLTPSQTQQSTRKGKLKR